MPTPQPDLKSGPPPVPLALVEWLEAVYPDRFPDVSQGMEYLQVHAGIRIVVRLLREHADRQAGRVQPGRQPQRSESPF